MAQYCNAVLCKVYCEGSPARLVCITGARIVTQVVGLSSGAQYTVYGTRGSNTGPLLAVSHSPCSLETVRMLECIHTTALLVCCQGYLREPVILCGGCERNRELRLSVERLINFV